jgi:glycosyltransferase involved in cell wall biosynthesis
VAIVTREVEPEGGLTLAAFRLATALAERGEEAEVLYSAGRPPADPEAVGRRVVGGGAGAVGRELERLDPAVVLVASGALEDVLAAAAVAPTAVHAQLHSGVCADDARYWARAGRSCGVRAGWHCTALRPLLGCSDLKRSLDPRPVAMQRRLLEAICERGLGIVAISTDQAERYARHGVPRAQIAVVPNLGIKAPAAELDAAARATPIAWRNAVGFFGRLSKPKGGRLLVALAEALPAELRFRVFGDGYLGEWVTARMPAEAMCGHVSQSSVLGVLMWARAVVFPSLWPEPGGIVGIDAQLVGAPLTAFDVGAPRHWPAAHRVEPGDVGGMAEWLRRTSPQAHSRDAEAVAAAQARYWERIGALAQERLGAFAAGRGFGPPREAPAEELMAA